MGRSSFRRAARQLRGGPSTALSVFLLVTAPLIAAWIGEAGAGAACERNGAADCDLTVLSALLWAGAALAVAAAVLDVWRTFAKAAPASTAR